ncbi:hypothetical protein SKAU_G00393690 [Synaphobranchus kaupii]|uniref:Replication factor C subunit 1 n=1 Tax=Synaphobranchus kaupii TaxID=118154 RepID=A0A9Q1EC19_SYNKA|nr:hypothetical protein SKAU_G00393690 [Synaphobranchus kaupii]
MDIRNFFPPCKPSAPKPPKNGSTSISDDSKKKKKSGSKGESSPKVEKSLAKRKKRAILDSDSEEEKPSKKAQKAAKEPKKSQKPSLPVKKDPVLYVSETDSEEEKPSKKAQKAAKEPKKSQKPSLPVKKDPVFCISETDSDSDTFESLKKSSKPRENGLPSSKGAGQGKARPPAVKSPPKPSSAPGKAALRSPVTPTTPKSAPPQPKRTPISVQDFFGGSSIQRSEKKLVASAKRKAERDDSQSDEAIAMQLQMDEDMELEKQLHEDEEFARTLSMLDEAPPPKKARRDSSPTKSSAAPAEKSGLSHTASSSRSQANGKASPSQEGLGPSAKANRSPLKTSSKLALMKKRDEEDGTRKKESPKAKLVISPKKEAPAPSSSAGPSPKAVTTPKMEKISPKKPQSVSPEDSEKKRGNSQAYRSYLNREGPRALGSKDIPEGAENCLEGLTFVVTGVLESMEREDAKSLIERYGGKVTGNVSRKTSYLVLGRDSGVSKTEKAQGFGTKILNEDGLLDLIRNKPGKRSKYEIAAEAENKSSKTKTPEPQRSRVRSTPQKSASKTRATPTKKTPPSAKPGAATPPGRPSPRGSRGEGGEARKGLSFGKGAGGAASLLWVDKYKPRALKGLIGQQGEQSCANKLLRWLQNWHRHQAGDKKPAARFGKFGGKDDGSGFKAALLSGPPGVGKTTTAALVCEELGYSYVEMNASCTRSKNSLKQVIAESLNNTSIKNFYTGASQTVSNKHALIMDEVDGMAGNEDRGGIQEMIGLIKQSKIPIICMCNDRNHQKIRSLANYCFDLRFQRPRVEQIKGAMMSIAFKEGLKVPPPALNEIILASNQDIRQVLHNLCMWSVKDKVMTYDQVKADAKNARKDLKMGPFDVCRKVFTTGEETAHMSLIDKSDLFFHDYSLAPLFVQENYLHVWPAAAGGNLKSHLVLLSKTADSICDGDLVDRQIRSRQTWSLLPTQAIYASVLPGELMRGYMSHFPTFPSWLGKFSSTGKHNRIVQELASHMSLKTHSSKQAVNLDYMPYLRSALLHPLERRGTEGAPQAVQLMDDYDLIKEDVDSIMEISTWAGRPEPYSKLDPKVKAAFTRAYNKESHLMPYSLQVVKKGKRGGGRAGAGGGGGGAGDARTGGGGGGRGLRCYDQEEEGKSHQGHQAGES